MRQLEALCRPGDVVIGISTSGRSKNVCGALERARQLKASTVALVGGSGGRMATLADICIQVPSTDPARIQEAHILFGHILCEWVEQATSLTDAIAAGGGAR